MIKPLFLLLLSSLLLLSFVPALSPDCLLLVGTYTSGDSKGIHVYSFDTGTGEFVWKSGVAAENPSYLAVSHDRKFVYAVNEVAEGKVSAFALDASGARLSYLNSVSSGGDGPCYVAADDRNRFVYAGNYGGGSITAIPVLQDGTLSQDIQTIRHEGKSIKPNQEKPHVHAAVLSPDNKFLFVPDLGTDKIYQYKLDTTVSRPLSPANPSFTPVAAGGGPRHFIFHPGGKFAYVIHENTGDITVYDYADGCLQEKQRVTMPPAGYTGDIHAADIRISPDGNFLYGSMRADINAIAVYSVDSEGRLKDAGRQSTLGKSPRNFAIDPSGNFLLAANQNSDEIVIFKRDKHSGLLTDTGRRIKVGHPVCLVFVSMN